MAENIYTIKLPALYGDHHVLEVRKLLMGVSGVESVYASSAFQLAEIETNASVTKDELLKVLEDAGYLGELPVNAEIEISPVEAGGKSKVFRHSSLYKQTRQAISFTQEVDNSGKTLWPCPGMGPIESLDD